MGNAINIVLDDGLQSYTFSNNDGEIFAEFKFNPADASIVERYDDVVEVFNKIDLKKEDEDIKDTMRTISDTFKEQFNYLLNRDVSEGLFKVYSPVTIFANGDFFAEVILTQVGKIIEKEMNVRLQKKAKKIEKYTKKYMK